MREDRRVGEGKRGGWVGGWGRERERELHEGRRASTRGRRCHPLCRESWGPDAGALLVHLVDHDDGAQAPGGGGVRGSGGPAGGATRVPGGSVRRRATLQSRGASIARRFDFATLRLRNASIARRFDCATRRLRGLRCATARRTAPIARRFDGAIAPAPVFFARPCRHARPPNGASGPGRAGHRRRAFMRTNLVCAMGPSAASTSRRTPSIIDMIRSTSPPKSACPARAAVSAGLADTAWRWLEGSSAKRACVDLECPQG